MYSQEWECYRFFF